MKIYTCAFFWAFYSFRSCIGVCDFWVHFLWCHSCFSSWEPVVWVTIYLKDFFFPYWIILTLLLKIELTLNSKDLFLGHQFISLIYISVLGTALPCLDCCSFVGNFEIGEWVLALQLCYFQDSFGYCQPLGFACEFYDWFGRYLFLIVGFSFLVCFVPLCPSWLEVSRLFVQLEVDGQRATVLNIYFCARQ